MKSTNVVKHSNIVDREKRSEALGTGKVIIFEWEQFFDNIS